MIYENINIRKVLNGYENGCVVCIAVKDGLA